MNKLDTLQCLTKGLYTRHVSMAVNTLWFCFVMFILFSVQDTSSIKHALLWFIKLDLWYTISILPSFIVLFLYHIIFYYMRTNKRLFVTSFCRNFKTLFFVTWSRLTRFLIARTWQVRHSNLLPIFMFSSPIWLSVVKWNNAGGT